MFSPICPPFPFNNHYNEFAISDNKFHLKTLIAIFVYYDSSEWNSIHPVRPDNLKLSV